MSPVDELRIICVGTRVAMAVTVLCTDRLPLTPQPLPGHQRQGRIDIGRKPKQHRLPRTRSPCPKRRRWGGAVGTRMA
jgi:hypothetical protein